MIKRIYQYADIPLTIGNQAVFMPQTTEWAGDIGTYTHSYKRYANSHRFIHQPTIATFSGDLIFDGTLLPAEIEQKLRSYIGFTDTLIVYTLPNDYPPQFDLCQPCVECIDCEVVWLSSPAILTSVGVDGSPDDGYKINLSFTLMDFFYPLNKLIWQYNGNYVQDYDSRELASTVEDIVDLLNCYPRCNDLFTDCISCRFFSRRNYNTLDSVYNPDTWEAFANDECCDYKYLFAQNFEQMQTVNGVTSFVTGFFAPEKIFQIDPKKWGALPSSIYAFRIPTGSLNTTCNVMNDDVYINIENTYNFGTVTKTEITKIPLNAVGSGDNILLVGNVSYYDETLDSMFRPAMGVNLSTGEVFDSHPLITYPSFSPGQLYPSRNKVKIYTDVWDASDFHERFPGCEDTGNYTQGFLEYAYIHLFRRV
jgi:hypothetical protein